ncbi:MAG: lipoprotein-releasing ABC transporter permease subunit [Maricaulaceae bacterium]
MTTLTFEDAAPEETSGLSAAPPAHGAAPFSGYERWIARRYLGAKRDQGGVALISMIAFVGVMLAVFVLIAVMSVMGGFRTALFDRILGVQGHVFVDVSRMPEEAALDAAARVAAVDGVIGVTPIVQGQAMASRGDAVSGVLATGIAARDLRDLSIVSDNLVAGSLDGFGEGRFGGDRIVIGDQLAANFGLRVGGELTLIAPPSGSGPISPFGRTVPRKTYVVGAIFSVGMSEFDGSFVYLPREQAQLFFGRRGRVDTLETRLADPDQAQAVRGYLIQAVGRPTFVSDWQSRNASYVNALAIERNVMRIILMLIVAIAAMNIISGLVMLVKNKGRDIAILRTMGASRGSILRIFFLAGASIGVLGTVCGVVLGVLFVIYIDPIQDIVALVTNADLFNSDIYYLSRIPAELDLREVGFIALWGFIASMLATIPPAWRAARLDPVEALRYE